MAWRAGIGVDGRRSQRLPRAASGDTIVRLTSLVKEREPGWAHSSDPASHTRRHAVGEGNVVAVEYLGALSNRTINTTNKLGVCSVHGVCPGVRKDQPLWNMGNPLRCPKDPLHFWSGGQDGEGAPLALEGLNAGQSLSEQKRGRLQALVFQNVPPSTASTPPVHHPPSLLTACATIKVTGRLWPPLLSRQSGPR